MGNCKDCIHWDHDGLVTNHYVDIPHGPGYRVDWEADEAVVKDQQQRLEARIVDLQGHYGECGGLPRGDDLDSEPPMAFTSDASAYYSVLITREDFGCVLFEGRSQ